MIVANNFRIEEVADRVELKCDISGGDLPEALVFRTTPDKARSLAVEEPNWAAVALIYPAMALGLPLKLEANISPLLLYNLRNDIQSLLRSYQPALKSVEIEAGWADPKRPRAANRQNITGFSAGIDSFCTSMIFDGPQTPESVRLGGLAVFDVGAFGKTGRDTSLRERAHKTAEEFAQLRGYSTWFIDSNLSELYEPITGPDETGFPRTVTLRNAVAALACEGGVCGYLHSSSTAWEYISCGAGDYIGKLDPILLPLLSTEGLRFQSAGAGLSRVAKTALVAEEPDSYTRLNVCVGGLRQRETQEFVNCARCWKCVQTMLALESLQKLDNYAEVFDLAYYRSHRRRLLQRLAEGAELNEIGRDSIRLARSRGLELPGPRLRRERVIRNGKNRLRGAWAALTEPIWK